MAEALTFVALMTCAATEPDVAMWTRRRSLRRNLSTHTAGV